MNHNFVPTLVQPCTSLYELVVWSWEVATSLYKLVRACSEVAGGGYKVL